MTIGTLVLGEEREEIDITDMGLEWKQIFFRGVVHGPRPEHTWRGLQINAPDGSRVYFDQGIQLHCDALDPGQFFTVTLTVDLPSRVVPQRQAKGAVRERRRKVSPAEAWES